MLPAAAAAAALLRRRGRICPAAAAAVAAAAAARRLASSGGDAAAAAAVNAAFARLQPVTDADVAAFRDILGDGGVITDPDALVGYNRRAGGREAEREGTERWGQSVPRPAARPLPLRRPPESRASARSKPPTKTLRDWMGKYVGASRVALRPRTTAQVAAVLARCHARSLPVVPQGGNTGRARRRRRRSCSSAAASPLSHTAAAARCCAPLRL
jgi:hypothetical protein